jgi:threonine dehydrogenase-like Zn-dependent dehydrogenase
MKAITVEPKQPGSARFEDFPEPDPREGSVLVEAVAVGVCGTDVEIVGSVNANKRHWYRAGNLLARSDRSWLAGLITRREQPENFTRALERQADDVKVVIQFSEV